MIKFQPILMTGRIRIFLFLMIITSLLVYKYTSIVENANQNKKKSVISVRKHNLDNPKIINPPDFSKSKHEVVIEEFRTFPDKLNINTERKEVLELLPMVGPRRAEEIVKYREEHGDFDSLQDLLKVPLMNQTIIDKIEDYIYFDNIEK